MTVAYSEGWGDAFSGMALTRASASHVPSPKSYQDSSGFRQSDVFDFELDEQPVSFSDADKSIGWYSESSVFKIFYQLFDSDNGGSDSATIPFSVLYKTLASLKDSESLISIYSFIDRLKQYSPADEAAINAIVFSENIEVVTDAYGSDESIVNNGIYMMDKPDILPVYTHLLPSTDVGVCSNPQFGLNNKLSVIQYIIFDSPQSANYRFTLSPFLGQTGDGKPAIEIYKMGDFVDGFFIEEAGELQFSTDLSYGRHMLLVYDNDNVSIASENTARRCFTVRVD